MSQQLRIGDRISFGVTDSWIADDLGRWLSDSRLSGPQRPAHKRSTVIVRLYCSRNSFLITLTARILARRRIGFSFRVEQRLANVLRKGVHVRQIRVAQDNDIDFFTEADAIEMVKGPV